MSVATDRTVRLSLTVDRGLYATEVLLCCDFDLPGAQVILVPSLRMNGRKRLAKADTDFVPHMLALFMTSNIQTATHKMAALTSMLCRLSNANFLYFIYLFVIYLFVY